MIIESSAKIQLQIAYIQRCLYENVKKKMTTLICEKRIRYNYHCWKLKQGFVHQLIWGVVRNNSHMCLPEIPPT